MKLNLFYSLPSPRDTCGLMLIGIFTIHEDDWLDIGIGLYFIEIGIHIFYGEGLEQ